MPNVLAIDHDRDGVFHMNSSDRDSAALALYNAEVALHAARQTQVDEWIRAASDRLHEAVLHYEAATAGCDCAVTLPQAA